MDGSVFEKSFHNIENVRRKSKKHDKIYSNLITRPFEALEAVVVESVKMSSAEPNREYAKMAWNRPCRMHRRREMKSSGSLVTANDANDESGESSRAVQKQFDFRV